MARLNDSWPSHSWPLTILKRVDLENGMNRWYLVAVQPVLFEPVAVVCAWGSRETEWQQWRVVPATSWDEAQSLATDIVAAKMRRGYIRHYTD